MGYHTNTTEERVAHNSKGKSAKDSVADVKSTARCVPKDFTLCKESAIVETMAGAAAQQVNKEEPDESVSRESINDDTIGVLSLRDSLESSVLGCHSQEACNADGASSSSRSSTSPVSKNDKAKRTRNPVHPKILAAGQRIISSELKGPKTSGQPEELKGPNGILSLRERLRSTSRDTTNTAASPVPVMLTPEFPCESTPRSTSPRSLRLSDEDSMTFDDGASQAVFSSSGEEDGEIDKSLEMHSKAAVLGPGPQLVMPSLSLPSSRPFTERGSRMGNFRVLVAGRKGAGKSTLIRRLLDHCSDVVHSDPPHTVSEVAISHNISLVETSASTKRLSEWKNDTDEDSHRSRRPSAGSIRLERNIMFMEIDTLEAHTQGHMVDSSLNEITAFIHSLWSRSLAVQQLNSIQLLELFTGGGGQQIDVLIYVIKDQLLAKESDLIAKLSGLTNVVPILCAGDSFQARSSMESSLTNMDAECVLLTHGEKPLQISNRPRPITLACQKDNLKTQKMEPNSCSRDCGGYNELLRDLFDPTVISKLRHASVKKLIRHHHVMAQDPSTSQVLDGSSATDDDRTPHLSTTCAPPMEASLTCSTISSPSGVLVPLPESSFYKTGSPALSAHTIDSSSRIPSGLELARLQEHELTPTSEIKEIRLAKWALDLQYSLNADNERKQRRWAYPQSSATNSASKGMIVRTENAPAAEVARLKRALAPAACAHRSALCSPDVTDPLGLMALGRRLRGPSLTTAVRMAGIGAALATIAVVCLRSWSTIYGFFPASWTREHAPTHNAVPFVAGPSGFGPAMQDASTIFGVQPVDMWDAFTSQVKAWVVVVPR